MLSLIGDGGGGVQRHHAVGPFDDASADIGTIGPDGNNDDNVTTL